MKHHKRRRTAALSVVALTLLAGAFQGMPAASAAVDAATADYSGYASSTPVHVDAIDTGTVRVADVQEAFSGAAVASKGLSEIKNEMQRVVAQAGQNTRARGAALEVGLVQAPSQEAQIILKGKAEAVSLPSPGSAKEEIGPVNLDPVAYASLLKATADTKWAQGGCVLNSDLSNGYAYAADAQLVNLAGPAADGTMAAPAVASDLAGRNATDSRSRLRLIPQQDQAGAIKGSNFGLLAETREVIAPVSLLRALGPGLTVDVTVAGEWVLQAAAGGIDGTSWYHYGPKGVSPDTPVLTVSLGGTQLLQLTTQQLLGQAGLHIPLSVPGVVDLDVAIGEGPRAIGGGFGSTPTSGGGSNNNQTTSVAVDIVRVTASVLGTLKVEDLRIGHMEARAVVPAGGIACPIPTTKTPEPSTVGTGSDFTTTIAIENPYDCDLTNVTMTDAITTDGGSLFKLGAISDGGTASGVVSGRSGSSAGTITWNLGTVPAHTKRSVTVKLTAAGRTGGHINDTVKVTGECGVGNADGTATVNVGLNGNGTLNVGVGASTAVLGLQLPRTGGPTPLYIAGAFLAVIGALFAGFKGFRLVRQKS